MTNETGSGALLATRKTGIVSTATFLVFEPGVYNIIFKAQTSGSSDVGLRLPCARLEAAPSINQGGKVFVTTLPDHGWISTETAAAYVLVVGGRAGALLTIYRSSDMVLAPTVEFRAVFKNADLQPAAVQPNPPTMPDPPAMPPPVNQPAGASADSLLSALVHFQEKGDVVAPTGNWFGRKGEMLPIEGFQLSAPSLQPGDVTYQGIMGQDWLTPWFETGSYCGSRNLNLPLLGFRVQLSPEAMRRFEIEYSGIFDGSVVVGPVKSGACEADGKILTGLLIQMRRKEPAAKRGRKAPGSP